MSNVRIHSIYICINMNIGLYRLCGSETKKKLLRDAFEQDPEAVDLTSQNVPDINVITSELKLKNSDVPIL